MLFTETHTTKILAFFHFLFDLSKQTYTFFFYNCNINELQRKNSLLHVFEFYQILTFRNEQPRYSFSYFE